MDIESVKKALGEFAEDFTVELQGNVIVVKAKYFLAKPKWDSANNALSGLGGKWTSMGKASHWRVPVGVVEANPKLTVEGSHIQKAVELMKQAFDELKQAGY